MQIYLVRHTEYSNPENVYAFYLLFNLSQKGRSRAQEIGAWFTQEHLQEIMIYTSPIARAIQTAEIISSKTNSFVSIDSRLREVACPDLEGKRKPSNNSWILDEENPSRETRSSVLNRMLSIFNEKVQAGKDCVFVSHGEGLALLYCHLLKKTLPKYLWDPINKREIIDVGQVVIADINNNSITATKKIF